MNTIGIKIKRLREINKLSQTELAFRLSVSQTALCNLESGETKKLIFH